MDTRAADAVATLPTAELSLSSADPSLCAMLPTAEPSLSSADLSLCAMLPTVSVSSAAALDPARAAAVLEFLLRAGGEEGALWRGCAIL
jgi:hypothetical protein